MSGPIGHGLPGLTGLDHVGLTVPDIEDATRFLVDVLGCEYLYSLAPIVDRGDWMREHLNVDPSAGITHLRFFRCGSSPVFEVFEYVAPDQSGLAPRNSDIGGHHFALYVTDIQAAVDYLRAAGVKVLGEPTASSGPHLGQEWVYFIAPWGAQFELVSYPAGRAWYRERGIEEPSLSAAASNGTKSMSQPQETKGTGS
ncbi:MAG: glyoxalase [Marmoricola sp.]|nr:glyoxalase [Marmoricola sp.]